jgi:hypothetical protein
MKQQIKALLATLLSFLPRQLPVGMTAFERLAERVHSLAGGICSLDDAKFVISTTIMRFDPNVTRQPDRLFVNTIRNAAAKQISGAAFQEVKTRQAEAQAKAAEEQAKQAEATALKVAASDGETTEG